MKKILFFPCLAILFAVSCGGNRSKPTATAQAKPTHFEMIKVPETLATPEQKAAYVGEHYWDNFDFADTSLISIPEVTEQGFVDYVSVLPYMAKSVYNRSVAITLEKASVSPEMLDHFIALFDKYLYNGGSQLRNDEVYIPVLEWIMASGKVDSLDKLRPAHQLEMVLKNRVGGRAADFQYTTPTGSVGSLYGINAPFTLIYFNNPGCSACTEMRADLNSNAIIWSAVASGKLAVLALYPSQDLGEWRKEIPNIPARWINGYDHKQAVNEGLYDLPAIPMLYLLDRDKTVLIKDAVIPQIVEVLQNSPNN